MRAGHPVRGALFAASLIAATSVRAASALELEATIPLAGVKGRIDHLSVDVKGHRLFVAALGNDTVEVLDTQRNQRGSIPGLGEPQGVLYLAGSNRLFIANGQADRVDVVDAGTLSVLKHVEDMPDADNVRYDAIARTVVVGYGRGALRFIDPATSESAGEVRLPGHPESFQLEQNGARAFVNVPSAHAVVVVDRWKRSVIAQWPTSRAFANFPMALDEAGHRLFVGARVPAVLLVYDTESGKVTTRVDIGGDTDDLFYDAGRKRIYVVCGEGRVDVLRQESPDQYVIESSTQTAPRARTGLFVPEESRLYVAAPATGSSSARVLVYRVR
jgi:DNA-binding beta-propeller fold protein YncE